MFLYNLQNFNNFYIIAIWHIKKIPYMGNLANYENGQIIPI
jgi:hypothetical protein